MVKLFFSLRHASFLSFSLCKVWGLYLSIFFIRRPQTLYEEAPMVNIMFISLLVLYCHTCSHIYISQNHTDENTFYSIKKRSFTWSHVKNLLQKAITERPERGSNPWPPPWQGGALTNWATGPSYLFVPSKPNTDFYDSISSLYPFLVKPSTY